MISPHRSVGKASEASDEDEDSSKEELAALPDGDWCAGPLIERACVSMPTRVEHRDRNRRRVSGCARKASSSRLDAYPATEAEKVVRDLDEVVSSTRSTSRSPAGSTSPAN